jgi:D-sedoheptulose 7-phosphate isomerase
MSSDKTGAAGYLAGLRRCLDEIETQNVAAVADEIFRAYQHGNSVYIFGNGGSATTASHMACDLAKTAAAPGKTRIKAFSLCDNTAMLTAVANDMGYDAVFVYQLEGSLRPGDVVVAISASGNSPNVVKAAAFAREQGARVVAFTGFGGGKLKALADVCISLESRNYGPVEDAHLILEHMITEMVRERVGKIEQYISGYEKMPETEEETQIAEQLAKDILNKEPW